MKIFIPFISSGIGGTNTFYEKFSNEMANRGHRIINRYEHDYDCLLQIAQAPIKYLIDAKINDKKIIQRLDGVYYWSVAGWKFPLFNLKMLIARHLFTNFTIYQSRFSKKCCQKFLGYYNENRSSIIYNGVDTKVFSPKGKKLNLRDNNTQHIFFTASAFRRPDQILPILESLKIFKKKYTSNFKLIIAGSFSSKMSYIPDMYKKFNQFKFIGPIPNYKFPVYARSSDVFLITHLNPPCPNNVIEAIACGLPVSGVADGAMPELVTSGKEGILLPIRGDAFWYPRSYDLNGFADNIKNITDNHTTYSKNCVLKARKYFDISYMIDQYEKNINNTIKS